MKLFLCLSPLVLLTACSTVPIQPPNLSGPTIVFTRDTGLVGGGCTFNALVDGEVVGKLDAGQTITKAVQNGKHRVGIDNTTLLCPDVKMSKVVTVNNEPAVFRVGITSNFQTIFDQTE